MIKNKKLKVSRLLPLHSPHKFPLFRHSLTSHLHRVKTHSLSLRDHRALSASDVLHDRSADHPIAGLARAQVHGLRSWVGHHHSHLVGCGHARCDGHSKVCTEATVCGGHNVAKLGACGSASMCIGGGGGGSSSSSSSSRDKVYM